MNETFSYGEPETTDVEAGGKLTSRALSDNVPAYAAPTTKRSIDAKSVENRKLKNPHYPSSNKTIKQEMSVGERITIGGADPT